MFGLNGHTLLYKSHIFGKVRAIDNQSTIGEGEVERRIKDRRVSEITPVFPLLTVKGRIMDDRRVLPDRRINNIQVRFLGDKDKAE